VTIYAVLTVGDGLVSQIPALLISTAAGIVVTRVASEDEGAHLGREIGEQVLAQPRAIAIAAGLLVILALVPGLPTVPFVLLALVVGSVAYGLLRRRRRRELPRAGGPALGGEIEQPSLPAAVAIEVGTGLSAFVDPSADGGRQTTELVHGLRELLFDETGVILPGVQLRLARRGGDALGPRAYRILLAEIPMAGGEVPDAVALASRQQLVAAGIAVAEELRLPGVAPPSCRIPSGSEAALRPLGIEVVDPPTQMVLHLGQVLRTHGHELVGMQETQQLLDLLEKTHPTLVHEVVPKIVPLQTLAEVLRRLLEEGLPVRQLREILEALAEWGTVERDPVVLVEHVRAALRRYISHRYAPGGATLHALLLDPLIEQTVRDSIHKAEHGSYLAIEPELSRDIVLAVRARLEALGGDEPPPVVLTTMEVRRYVRRLLEVDLPDLAVLSYSELLPQVQVQPVARVSV